MHASIKDALTLSVTFMFTQPSGGTVAVSPSLAARVRCVAVCAWASGSAQEKPQDQAPSLQSAKLAGGVEYLSGLSNSDGSQDSVATGQNNRPSCASCYLPTRLHRV